MFSGVFTNWSQLSTTTKWQWWKSMIFEPSPFEGQITDETNSGQLSRLFPKQTSCSDFKWNQLVDGREIRQLSSLLQKQGLFQQRKSRSDESLSNWDPVYMQISVVTKQKETRAQEWHRKYDAKQNSLQSNLWGCFGVVWLSTTNQSFMLTPSEGSVPELT